MSSKPSITVYFLGASRAIRVPWLLEELGVPYDLVVSPRSKAGVGPPEFKEKIPAPLKKSPTIKDGDLVVQESGAILEYLLETYDKSHTLLPTTPASDRWKIHEWLHAAEGSFMLYGLAILYARWKIPEAAQSHLPEMEENMSANVHNSMNWIESALVEQREKGRQFLVGEGLTVADVMMQFSVLFILTRELGVKGVGQDKWPETRRWLKACMERPGYKRAVERTGFTLESYGKFKT